MKLQDRIALVTGAGSGIGRAIALLFAEEGARVVANDVDLAAAEQTVGAMKPGQGRAVRADVADSAQVRAMFAEIERAWGRLDVLVNNAGIARAPGEDVEGRLRKSEARLGELLSPEGITTHWDVTQAMSDETWRRMLAVHLDGTFFCSREALRLMSRQNAGVIINMSSVAGLTGLEVAPHYSAAKGGILAFTRAVAREVGSRNIRVNAICPGFIDTPMTAHVGAPRRTLIARQAPLGRWGEPREIAATALFLASDDAAFFTGQWLSPNGGLFIG
ncbi:MAG: SDR family oxidoreductase [Candidatus Rokuibacteriota bacterium]